MLLLVMVFTTATEIGCQAQPEVPASWELTRTFPLPLPSRFQAVRPSVPRASGNHRSGHRALWKGEELITLGLVVCYDDCRDSLWW